MNRLDTVILPPRPIGRQGILAWCSVFAALVLACEAGWMAWGTRSLSLVVDPNQRSLVGLPANQNFPLRFTIRNPNGRAVRIIGADDRCDDIDGCAATKGLPLTVPARTTVDLDVVFKTRASPYTYRLALITDDPDNLEVVILISG